MALTVDEVATHLAALAALGSQLELAGQKLRDDAQKLRADVAAAKEDGSWSAPEKRRVVRDAWKLGHDAGSIGAKVAPIVAALVKDALD